MVFVIGAATAAGAALLYGLSRWKAGIRRVLDGAAVLAGLAFFAIAANSVLRTVLNDTVFMTQVHEVFLNPVLLVCGAYLGPYGLSLLVERTFRR